MQSKNMFTRFPLLLALCAAATMVSAETTKPRIAVVPNLTDLDAAWSQLVKKSCLDLADKLTSSGVTVVARNLIEAADKSTLSGLVEGRARSVSESEGITHLVVVKKFHHQYDEGIGDDIAWVKLDVRIVDPVTKESIPIGKNGELIGRNKVTIREQGDIQLGKLNMFATYWPDAVKNGVLESAGPIKSWWEKTTVTIVPRYYGASLVQKTSGGSEAESKRRAAEDAIARLVPSEVRTKRADKIQDVLARADAFVVQDGNKEDGGFQVALESEGKVQSILESLRDAELLEPIKGRFGVLVTEVRDGHSETNPIVQERLGTVLRNAGYEIYDLERKQEITNLKIEELLESDRVSPSGLKLLQDSTFEYMVVGRSELRRSGDRYYPVVAFKVIRRADAYTLYERRLAGDPISAPDADIAAEHGMPRLAGAMAAELLVGLKAEITRPVLQRFTVRLIGSYEKLTALMQFLGTMPFVAEAEEVSFASNLGELSVTAKSGTKGKLVTLITQQLMSPQGKRLGLEIKRTSASELELGAKGK